MLLTQDRFGQVMEAASQNVQMALDLIAIHSEQEVRGRQPRASLNPFTVVAAVGSWERFIADLTSAATKPSSKWHGPGGHSSGNGSHWPSAIDSHLIGLGLLRDSLTSRWEAKFPTKPWVGIEPRGWQVLHRDSSAEERRMLLDYLAETRRTRNGAAHFALLQNALDAADADGWYPWQSDAEHPSLQSGYARGVTAVYLQLIDCTAVLVADTQGWSVDHYRLPEDWFRATSQLRRFAGVQFWAGTSLHRAELPGAAPFSTAASHPRWDRHDSARRSAADGS